MKIRLSSILVPIYKSAPLFAALIFLINIPVWVKNNFSWEFIPGFLFIFIWGGVFYFATARWKNVYLRGEIISASNFLKKIEIPVSAVSDIEASSWWGWQPRKITVKLKSRTEFGEEIVFVPRGLGFTATTQAEELKRLLNLK
jgi:hypothetical protein